MAGFFFKVICGRSHQDNHVTIKNDTFLAIAATMLCRLTASAAEEKVDRCSLQPVKGPCKAMIEKFYFEQSAQKCRAYFYDGCGPVVPFDTLETCIEECEKQPQRPAARQPDHAGLKRDPIESAPEHRKVFEQIDSEVQQSLSSHPQKGSMGFVHIFWETKKRLLKQKYGINWRSPAEMNPHVMFD